MGVGFWGFGGLGFWGFGFGFWGLGFGFWGSGVGALCFGRFLGKVSVAAFNSACPFQNGRHEVMPHLHQGEVKDGHGINVWRILSLDPD